MRKINVVFLGGFSYPHGMAGTKRIQHAIDVLKEHREVTIHVVVLRQSSASNALSGTYRGVSYETVMGDLFRTKALLMAPVFHMKAKRTIRRYFQPCQRNILFVYGPPSMDNVPVIRHARRLGYKIVFDIVEDDSLASPISTSLWHRVKNSYVRRMLRDLCSLADGLVVISSHLEAKFRRQLSESIPVHVRSISVDMGQFADRPHRRGDMVTLFYSGSFGLKDGVLVLLSAFERLATTHKNLRLVLTGKGNAEVMKAVVARMAASAHKDRVDYRGYLDEDAYYAALNNADIPCMTRIDHPYAQAGFPFKLGEFLATAQPVVASKVSDVAQFLGNRQSAMLVEPGSASAVVAAVEYLLDNPDAAISIGLRGREVARRHFCHRRQAESLYEFIGRVGQGSPDSGMSPKR